MSHVDPLNALRSATIKKEKISFIIVDGSEEKDTELIKDATDVKFGEETEKYPLDEVTKFYNEDKPQTLRAVVFCWLHEKSSIVDYKNECLELGIPDFKFLVKTELTTWLNGNSDTCAFVKDDVNEAKEVQVSEDLADSTSQNGTSVSKKRKLTDPQLERIHAFERECVDHNAVLRGSKNIDFGYLISDAKRFISQLKKSKPSSSSHQKQAKTAPKKQPIIIISPASTALISLSNIKEFLEDGKFVPPSRKTSGIVTINHKSDRLVSAAQRIMVVDNTDMFTKPEYWDRVIAIFTTGQSWQFSKYKYSRPELLFQRYTGYYVSYTGDVTPKQIRDWNVREIKVDRGEKRFRDKMIVKDFWAEIEKILISKGHGRQ
ncbi:uncharacterized protein PRCAT00003794001 [Priceomyces carsonii]|uniref:uncharacterized protein n=1 Tax=Priceomyces carsonii TaxID=28549 RepID=UPI002ED77D89|nr:unnamed protein product [Priceomyces carsonii]